MSNNLLTNDIEVIQWNRQLQGHYFHEFEESVFIPLQTSRLKRFQFAITDENNKILNLIEGAPTVLSVSFKK